MGILCLQEFLLNWQKNRIRTKYLHILTIKSEINLAHICTISDVLLTSIQTHTLFKQNTNLQQRHHSPNHGIILQNNMYTYIYKYYVSMDCANIYKDI